MGFVVLWGPHVGRRLVLLSLQRQCLAYEAPADSVVFDSRATSLPQLPRSDPDLLTLPFGARSAIGRSIPCWRDYYLKINHAPMRSASTAYLHRARSPAGNERLIAIDLYTGVGGLSFNASTLTVGNLGAPPSMLVSFYPRLWLEISRQQSIAVFAGQPDPQHADHFTMTAIIDGAPQTIDGWLTDEDHVDLGLRPAHPLTQPSTTSTR
jgi:hypothetical protein